MEGSDAQIYRKLGSRLGVVALILDLQGRVVDATTSAHTLFAGEDGFVGQPIWRLPLFAGTPSLVEHLRQLFADTWRGELSRDQPIAVLVPPRVDPWELHITATRDRHGVPIHLIADLRPSRPPTSAWESATFVQAVLPTALRHSPNGAVVIAPDGYMRDVNAAFASMLGWSPHDLIGRRIDEVVHPDDRAEVAARREMLGAGVIRSVSTRRQWVCLDGSSLWTHVVLSVTRDASDRPHHFVLQVVDISDTVNEEQRLEHLALHDPLTGLLNRAGFLRRLDEALDAVATSGSRTQIVFADIDNFKRINDTWGHRAGDLLLAVIADRLRAALPGAAVARYGGDEFAAIVPGPSDAGVVRHIVATVERPILDLPDLGVPRISVGAVTLVEPRPTVVDLLAALDQAMYATKNGHGYPRHSEHSRRHLPPPSADLRGEPRAR